MFNYKNASEFCTQHFHKVVYSEKSRMENIYTCYKPFYVLSKCLGMFPMSFEGPPRKGKLKVKWHDWLLPGFATLIPTAIIAVNIFCDDSPASTSPFLSKLWVIEILFGVFLMMTQFPYQLLKHRNIEEFLNRVHHFDQKVELLFALKTSTKTYLQAKHLNLSTDFKNQRKITKIFAIAVTSTLPALFLIALAFYYFNIGSNCILFLGNVYAMLFNCFYTAQFACAALALRERFKLVNEYMKNFTAQTQAFDKQIVMVSSENFNLKRFSDLYNDLCDAISMINSTFTGQLIIVMTNMLLVDIFGAYGILREFLSHSYNRLKFLILCNSIWIALQYAVKFLMAQSGSSTTAEAEMSLVIITRVIENAKDDKLKTDLNLLLNQMQGRNKKIENVFFVINYKLILAVSF